MKTLEEVLLRQTVTWAEDVQEWVFVTNVDWDYCSPNLRVQARKAGYCPATFLCFDGVHPVK